MVTLEPAPGRVVALRLGESFLQLCGHGTHHRAQAAILLRTLGAEPPGTAYLDWLEGSAAS